MKNHTEIQSDEMRLLVRRKILDLLKKQRKKGFTLVSYGIRSGEKVPKHFGKR